MENFEQKYSWVEDCYYSEDFGVIVRVSFDPFDYEEAFNAKSDHWIDSDGYDNDITYFIVGRVSVTILDHEFLIESENDDEISKALQHIDAVLRKEK